MREKPKGSKHFINVSIKFNSLCLLTQLHPFTSLTSFYVSRFAKSACQPEVTVCSKTKENESLYSWSEDMPGTEWPGFRALLQGLFKYFSQSRINAIGESEEKILSMQAWALIQGARLSSNPSMEWGSTNGKEVFHIEQNKLPTPSPTAARLKGKERTEIIAPFSSLFCSLHIHFNYKFLYFVFQLRRTFITLDKSSWYSVEIKKITYMSRPSANNAFFLKVIFFF